MTTKLQDRAYAIYAAKTHPFDLVQLGHHQDLTLPTIVRIIVVILWRLVSGCTHRGRSPFLLYLKSDVELVEQNTVPLLF